MALTEIQLKIFRFHGSLRQKGSRPVLQLNRLASFSRMCWCVVGAILRQNFGARET